jgi:hypothetical protein
MRRRSQDRWGLGLVVGLVVGLGLMLGGCLVSDPAPEPDATLVTHEVVSAEPEPDVIAYAEKIAAIHSKADAASQRAERLQILHGGLELERPGFSGDLEVLHLELAARTAETLLEDPADPAAAAEILAPLLDVGRSLPRDRATARALVVLGDAAAQDGDQPLAAGSYARAIRLMSLLRRELEQQ